MKHFTQFMLHDVDHQSTELRSFLAQVSGVNSEKYKSYFTERGIAAAAGDDDNDESLGILTTQNGSGLWM